MTPEKLVSISKLSFFTFQAETWQILSQADFSRYNLNNFLKFQRNEENLNFEIFKFEKIYSDVLEESRKKYFYSFIFFSKKIRNGRRPYKKKEDDLKKNIKKN